MRLLNILGAVIATGAVGGAAVIGGCATAAYPDLGRAKSEERALFIGDVAPGRASKKGAVPVAAQFFNTSNKTYKYVVLGVVAYNRVGDPIRERGDETALVDLRFTGPLPPRRTPGIVKWPRVWYASALTCIEVRRVRLVHMDSSERVIEGGELLSMLSRRLQKGCRGVKA